MTSPPAPDDARGGTHVLVVGLSARALAQSAVRAGFLVTTLDAFADLDLPDGVRGLSLPREFNLPFSASAAARVAASIASDAVVYASNFENDPDAVAALAAGRALWGNPACVLPRVRDPGQVAAAFSQRGIRVPVVWTRGGSTEPPESVDPGGWLVKPLASGGGRAVRAWTGAHVPNDCYLQQRIGGTPGSVVFVAAGRRAVPLGLSRQLVGDPAFGAEGYRYCGNILSQAGGLVGRPDALLESASAVAFAAADAFDLAGVNGVDFVHVDGTLYPIEINPRWCASMELVERAYDLPVFALHAEACRAGALPSFELARARLGARAVGKAIVFARTDVTMGDTRSWLVDTTVRDVPHPGECIQRGHPICTVIAEGADDASCYRVLTECAARVYASVERT